MEKAGRSSDDHTQLVRNLVRMHGGGAPENFHATADGGGRICVRGPCSVAFYPLQAWLSRFLRHLQLGYFSPARSVRPGHAVP
jgi:hypothetical protein